MPTADDDFAPEDFAPPGHTWTEDDELALLRHRQALASWPTSRDMPAAVMTNQQKGKC
jgi:hypothetical protein